MKDFILKYKNTIILIIIIIFVIIILVTVGSMFFKSIILFFSGISSILLKKDKNENKIIDTITKIDNEVKQSKINQDYIKQEITKNYEKSTDLINELKKIEDNKEIDINKILEKLSK